MAGGTAWRPAGLQPSVPAQELLLQANIKELRCAVPRSRGEPQLQVTPAPHALGGAPQTGLSLAHSGGRGPELPGHVRSRPAGAASHSPAVSRFSHTAHLTFL